MATSMFAIGFIFILLAFAMPVLAYVQQKPNYRPMALMLGAVVGSVISFGALAVAYELPGGW
jgi:nitrate reductase gamma subunit